MRAVIISALLLAGCAVRPDPKLEAELAQHREILNAIATYVNELQSKGVLPVPEKKAE